MRLQAHGASKALTGTTATGHRFVVLATAISKAEIVHRALTSSKHAKGTKKQIAQSLRHLHIPSHHSSRCLRIQQATQRNAYLQRCKATFIQWNVVVEQTTDHVQHNRTGNRKRCVEISQLLLRCSTKIQQQFVLIAVLLIPANANLHRQGGAIIQVQLMARISQTRDQTPNTGRRMILQPLHLFLHHRLSLPFDQALEPFDTRLVCGHLGL